MRFCSPTLGLEYVEICKAACCSIKAALLAAEGIEAGTEMHNHSFWAAVPGDFKPRLRFTFVRHPFERLQSSYREKLKTGYARIVDVNCDLPDDTTFRDWVRWVTSQPAERANKHWAPQSCILGIQERPIAIFHLEQIDAIWARMQRQIDGLPDLPHLNATESTGDDRFDCESFHRARSFYCQDLAEFGYSAEAYRPRPTLDAWQKCQGFLHPSEAAELQQLAAGKRILEIGVWKGRSTVAMAATAERIVSVDAWYGDNYAGRANTAAGAWENICSSEARERVSLVSGDLRDVLPRLCVEAFDVAFYDADHTYAATVQALRMLSGISGPIAVHDYDSNPNHAGVRKAVDQFAIAERRSIRTVERLAILE